MATRKKGKDVKHGSYTSPAALRALEDALATPRYYGVPMGSTLGDIFILHLRYGQRSFDVSACITDMFRWGYHIVQPLGTNQTDLSAIQDRFLLTWQSDRPNFNGLVFPVVSALGSSRCVIVGRDEAMEEQLPDGTKFIIWRQLPRSDGQWFIHYAKAAPVWLRTLWRSARHYGLPYRAIPYLMDCLLVQAKRVASCRRLLESHRPSVIVTEYDRNRRSSILVLVAKTLGIPTVTLVHGVIGEYGYTPLLADKVLCWGQRQKQKFIESGVSPDRVSVVGYPRMSRDINASSATVRAKMGLPARKPVVLLATNPIPERFRLALADAFCTAFSSNPDMVAAVRLHPSENVAFYKDIMASYPSVRFTENQEWTVDESLAAADVVVCHNTGFGVDALVKRRIVVVLDTISFPLGPGEELIQEAGAPRASSAKELYAIVEQIVGDEDYRRSLRLSAERYVNHCFAAFGSDAANNIANEVFKIKGLAT